MSSFGVLSGGLNGLPLLDHGKSRSVNAENPRGEKGKGCMAASKLGPSRKGSACISSIEPGETALLMDVEGIGVIQHIWITVTDRTPAEGFVLRDLVLRMYWDGEEVPSVEAPLGDFFCCGFGRGCLVNSMPIAVNPTRGMNCYFPMPFRKNARITVESQHPDAVPGFFYQIDYCLYDSLPEDIAYFHAQWRREAVTVKGRDYVLLDGVKGPGQYVGTYLALSTLERYWWGEGEFKFYIDGDGEYPTVCSTGTEDYFGGAWSFASREKGQTVENTYCTPFMGYPFYSNRDEGESSPYYMDDCPPMRGFYRWHLPDPIRFEESLRVELQQIGVCNSRGLFERQDDVSSVSYWYQSEPHETFPPFPGRHARIPR